MNFLLKITRVCVPLSLDCNLHCKYCYRDKEKLDAIPAFTEDMISYLGSLKPDKCECVCASGGEPLMHWDKVKELFSYVPKNVHKKVMSNCLLLTQEIVDYLNENNIELSVSHDGKLTKFLRGVDVLRDKRICNLVRQVKIMRVVGVVTKYNVDVWENFFDTATLLRRTNFEYVGLPLNDIPAQYDLIDGFDYDTWSRTWFEFTVSPYRRLLPWYRGITLTLPKTGIIRRAGFNVLPNGVVCGIANICSNYGTVNDDFMDCYEKLCKTGEVDYCKNANCKFIDICRFGPTCDTEHIRRYRTMVMEFKANPERVKSLRMYVREHLSEIEKKYGYIREQR